MNSNLSFWGMVGDLFCGRIISRTKQQIAGRSSGRNNNNYRGINHKQDFGKGRTTASMLCGLASAMGKNINSSPF
jgi:hypothetical protein